MAFQKKHISILGSTGSIGTQTLEVIDQNPDLFVIDALTANNNADLLIQQALKYKPNAVVIVNHAHYQKVSDALFSSDIKVFAGKEALEQIATMNSTQLVITAMVGFAGLLPTIKAIESKKNIALANKETLVVAGEIITTKAQEMGVNIYPIDSEHSAIFQCLLGEFHNKVERIILTASGGPFRGKTKSDLKNITPQQALKHPNWSMGSKISIDSATLMNKGLEVIEAKWLFGVPSEKIEVLVHPQSVIHSMVEFEDGSIKAQLGYPDMKIPIGFALSYPHRYKNSFTRFSFLDYPTLTFEKPDTSTFKCLNLAFDALKQKGNICCALNAANEVAVELFLQNKIRFLQIAELIEHAINTIQQIKKPNLQELIDTDKQARELCLLQASKHA